MSKKLATSLMILAVLWLASGCAVNRATANLTPGTDLSRVKQFYVVSAPADKNAIDKLIKDKLEKMGYTATIGPEKSPPYQADAVVTYQDKWMWDISMYMIELTITLRNPATDFPMAVGNSLHTSLTRKSQEEMVEEVLGNIFKENKQGS